MFVKSLLIFACLSFPFANIVGQNSLLEKSEKYIGFSQGMNTSMILFNPSVKQHLFFPGYNGGITYRYITEKHAGLQIELKYSQRGWSESDGNYVRRTNYVELPFLTHVYIGNKNRVFFNIGPKISYLLSESVLKNDTVNSISEQHVKSIRFPFDYGLCAAFGYYLKTKSVGAYEIEFRGYYGLGDSFANTRSDYFLASNYLNFSLNIGWYFQLSGDK